MTKCLGAYLGWGICQRAQVIGATIHRCDGNHLRGFTVSAPSLVSHLVDLNGHVCGLVGQAKKSELHSDLPVSVATNGYGVQGLALSHRIYAKVECL